MAKLPASLATFLSFGASKPVAKPELSAEQALPAPVVQAAAAAGDEKSAQAKQAQLAKAKKKKLNPKADPSVDEAVVDPSAADPTGNGFDISGPVAVDPGAPVAAAPELAPAAGGLGDFALPLLGALAIGGAAMAFGSKGGSGSSTTATSATPEIKTAANGLMTVAGVATAGSKVVVQFPDGSTVTAVAGTDGTYSASSATPQSSGTVTSTVTLPSGETLAPVSSKVVDTTAPVAPSMTTTPNANGTVTVGGTAEAGSTVKVTFADGTTATAVVPTSGTYAVTSAAPQTSGSIKAVATDAAGNASTATTGAYVDKSAPTAPTMTTTPNANGTLTVAGTGEPGSTVKVTFPDGTTGTAIIPASGAYAVTSATPQTSGSAAASVTDPAGNTSTAASKPFVDTSAPAAPASATTTNPNGTLTVSGTAEPGSSVTVTFPDGTSAIVPVGANGTYSATSATPQTSGSVSTTATDAAGNVSPTMTKTVSDTTAPVAPTAATTPNANGTLTVSGTGEPGSTVKVTFRDGTIGTAVVPASGAYSVTSSTPQTSGPVATTVTDAAGNTSSPTASTFADTTPPAAPTSGTTANANGTLTTSGTGEPGSTVKVTFPDGTSVVVPVAANGTYSATSAAPQGSGTVTAVTTDAAGNASAPVSKTYSDTTAPVAPTTTTSANPNGTLTVSGTGEPGSTVKVTFPDGSTGTAIVPASGAYAVTSVAPQTSGPISAVVTDAAGNASPVKTATFADTSAPVAPTMTTTPNANGTLTASGTAEPGSTVKVTFPDGTTATAVVPASGTYALTSAAPQTSGVVKAVATDVAGNVSPATTTSVTDTTAPAAPTLVAATNPDGTVKVSGTGEPGSTVSVTFPDGSIGTAVIPASGAYAITSPTAQPSGPISASVVDKAGNVSPTTTKTVSDTTAPVAPTAATTPNANGTLTVSGTGEPGSTVKVTFPDGSTKTVIVAADGTYVATSAAPQTSGTVSVTSTDAAGNVSPATTKAFADSVAPATPVLTTTTNANGTITAGGTAEPGSTVKVVFPDGSSINAPVAANGTFSATSAAAQPSGSVTATATDAAGNTSPAATKAFADATPPATPTLATTANPDGTLKVSGTGEPGSTVKVTFPDGSTGSATVAPNGSFAVTSTQPQSSGPISVIATDAAGNASPAATATFADTTAPAAPSLTPTTNADGTLKVSGTAEPGSTVKITFPDGSVVNAPVAANGTYSATSAAPQPSGSISAVATDPAGNASPAITKASVDTTPPAAPAVATVANPDGTLKVSGTGEPGSTVKVTFPDGSIKTVPVDANGAFTATSAAPQTSGNVTAVATDAAGNASPAATKAFSDATAPAAPTMSTASNANGSLTASGTGEPGSTVKVTFPDGTSVTATVAANGTYTATSAAAQPSGTVSAISTDAAGNASPATTTAFADTTAPSAPTLVTAANGNGTLTASGTGEPGSTVKVTFPDGSVVNASVAVNGTYSATSAAPQSSGSVSAVATDAAGNASPAATKTNADVSAPAAPTLSTTAKADGSLTVSGTGEPGSSVKVTFPDGTVVNAPVAADGTYAATSAGPQPSGTVTAVATDAAGNASPAVSASVTDTTAPAAPAAPTATIATNPDGTLKVSGTGEPGSAIKVTFPDGTTANAVVAADGTYAATSTAPQTSGTVKVIDTDAAGNASPIVTKPYVDVTAPVAPTLSTAANANGTLTASGTGEPGSTVKVTFPDGTVVNAPVAANGTYAATSAAAQPSGTVTAVVTDAVGNASPAATKVVTDSSAPAAPVVGTAANADGTVTASGTAESGSSVKVTFPDGTIKTVTAAADGSYAATSAAAQPSGNVSVVATDAAGNASPAATKSFADSTAPAAPIVGTAANANGTVTASGTAEPGSSVKVTFPDGTIKTVTAAADGSYSATSAAAQPSGSVSVVATDPAGNVSPAATKSFADVTAPTAPVVGTTANANGTVTASGTAEPGSSVKVTFPDGSSKTATAAADGSYAATSAAAQPSGSVSVVATDPAGNASPAATKSFADATAPAAPVVGTAANVDGTVTASGTAEPGSSVKVTFPDGTSKTVTAAADGSYSATSAAAQPSGNVSVVATDAAGNASLATTKSVADTNAPAAPVVGTVANADGTVTASGTAEPGSSVKVTFPDGTSKTVTAAADGSYVATSAAAQPSGSVSVVATDTAGNASPAATKSFADVTAPAAPTVGVVENANGTLTASGTGEPGSTVKVTFPDGSIVNATVAANGSYTATSAAAQQSGTVTAVDTDAAGNTSPAASATYTHTAPVAPVLSSVTDNSGTVKGAVASGATTDEAKPVLAGTGTAGDTVKVYDGATLVGSAVVDNTGHWSITTSTLADGAHTLSITQTDPAGVASSAVTTTFTVNTTTPAVSDFSALADTGLTIGYLPNSGVTSDNTLTLSGNADPNSTIKVYDGATLLGTASTNAFGHWQLTPSSPLADGAHSLTAVETNAAGNIGAASTPLAFTVDTTAPTAPTFVAGSNVAGNGTLTGTAEAGSTVKVYLAGHATPDYTTTADNTGNWSLTAAAGVSTGGTVSVTAMDAAGNVSPVHTAAAQFLTPFTAPSTMSTLTAGTSYAQAGYSVSKIGDFNGDGIDDFVIGAPASESGHVGNKTSEQYIVYGKASGVPTASLDSLNASQGINITATTFKLPNFEYGQTGQTVTNLGDINGDGFADVGISSNANDRAYVLFGRGGNANTTIDLGSIDASNNGQATADGFVIVNYNTGAWNGTSLSGGDINGDGYGDIIVGSLDGGGNGQGQYTVYYGHAGSGGTTAWENLYTSVDGLHQINANAGYGDRLNYTEASPVNTTYNAGGGTFDGDADLGARVAVIADVNGDGYNDYIVTAPRADKANVYDTGTAYLMFGGANGLAKFDLDNLSASQGVRLTGSEYGEQLGGSFQTGVTTTQGTSNLNSAFTSQSNDIANIGDINGDGIADFAVGSPGWGNQQLDSNGPGRVYVVFGRDSGVNWSTLSLGALDGTNGFILHKPSAGASSNSNTSVNQLGWSVAGGVDMNGDGLDDMVVSAPGEANSGNKNVGAVYIVYGKVGGSAAFPSLNDLDAMVTAGTAKKLTGAAAKEYFGSSVSTGDFNGDGIGDVAIGAAGVATSAGATYVSYGQTAGFTQVGSTGNDDLLAGATTSGLSAIVGGVDGINGGAGNDIIHGIGAASDTGNAGLFDVAYGAAGNDTIGITGMNFTRVDGGLGSDTLKVEGGSPLAIDVAALATKVQGFEAFDLANSGSTLTVSTNDVLRQKSVVTSDFLVKGGASDHVVLTNDANAQWNATGATKTVGGVTYDVYHSTSMDASNTNADVLIQQGVKVDLTPAAQITQTATATMSYAYSGYEVANIGDFNGDGISDVLVSAPANEAGLEQYYYKSKQYLVYGDQNGVPKVNLDAMTADQGIVISTTKMSFGSIELGTTGNTVSAIGDINADGYADFAMSSNRGDSAFVVFGRGGNTANAIDLADVTASKNGNATADGFIIANYNTGAWMGTGLSGGDVNGDGYGDVIVGSSDGGGNGQATVLYGHAGAGGTAAWQNLYAATDGLHNVGTNAAYGTVLATTAAQTITTTEYTTANYTADSDLGDRIGVVGDVNGDGYNDYIVTAPRADSNGVADTGTAYLLFGSAGGLGNFDLKNLTAAQGVKLKGSELGESLGGTSIAGAPSWGGTSGDANVHYAQSHSVAKIGDINGDGIDDFAIGSPGWGNQNFYDSGAGRTYIMYGQAKGVAWSDASLGSLNGTTGFILSKASAGTSSGSNTSNNQLGWSIAGGGDFNGDGIDDMVVSAPGENVSGNTAAGAAYVIYGQAGANVASTFTSSTNLDALVTSGKAVKFTGNNAQEYFGASVAMGDFNGDGLADIAVGAPGNSAGGTDAGQTSFIYGSQANLTQAASVNDETLAAGGTSTGYTAIVGGVDRIAGGLGNDTITGIGSASDTGNAGEFDVAYGGAGNDTISIDGTNFNRVDGGLGNDQLTINASGMTLDLNAVGNKVQGFETFDINGSGANTLKLTLSDVLQQTSSPSQSLSILGGADDTVVLAKSGTNTWTTSNQQVIDGHTFDVYHNAALAASNQSGDVLIEHGINVTVV